MENPFEIILEKLNSIEKAIEKLVSSAKDSGVELIGLPGSVLDLEIPAPVSLWHDRAVLHFLTDESDIAAYKSKLIECTSAKAIAVIATFSENGPDQCSGLNVRKYSVAELAERFAPQFRLVSSESRIHTTPWESNQEFSVVVLDRFSNCGHETFNIFLGCIPRTHPTAFSSCVIPNIEVKFFLKFGYHLFWQYGKNCIRIHGFGDLNNVTNTL